MFGKLSKLGGATNGRAYRLARLARSGGPHLLGSVGAAQLHPVPRADQGNRPRDFHRGDSHRAAVLPGRRASAVASRSLAQLNGKGMPD